MKHRSSFIASVWWLLALFLAGVFLMAVSPKHSRESETENRMLAEFPTLSAESVASDKFMTGFEEYLSDAFFMRDSVISFTNRLIDGFSMLSGEEARAADTLEMEKRLEEEGAMLANAGDTAPVDAQDEPPETFEAGDALLTADAPIEAQRSFLWLKRVDDTNNIIYTYNRDNIATYADTLRVMQSFLPSDGVICFTQVPLASIANRWTDQQFAYKGWGSSVEIMLEDCLKGSERIYVFNTFDILAPHMTKGAPLFYQTDHHWSPEGAYIVAAEMLKKQNLPVIPYEEYDYKPIVSAASLNGLHDTFNVLYPLLPSKSYVLTRITSEVELSLMNYNATSYVTFMNNSRTPWRKIITGANTGRRALVICDSFGNAFTPYLLPYYDQVHMCDFRKGYYDKQEAGESISKLIVYHQIDDVYIVTSTANGLRKDNSLIYLRQYLLN